MNRTQATKSVSALLCLGLEIAQRASAQFSVIKLPGFRFAAALLAVATVTSSALAQDARGTIVGRITDPSGASVAGATVEVKSQAQGTVQTFTTNESGQYTAPYLIPGTYTVTVTAPGFKTVNRENIEVTVNDRRGVDVTLEVGAATESVTVSAESPLLDTVSGSAGQVIDTKRIAELPIAHGQPFSLIGLTAGASFTGSQTLDRPYEPTHIAGYAVNGTYSNRSDITIDGIPATATANVNEITASYVPPQDAVQEFRVQTSTFDAQFGNTEGGSTNISIKSGTNDWHGSAYYYKQAPVLFANNWFANANNQERTDFDYDRWGGFFGGPVILPGLYNGRNRTFFMYAPEGFKDSRPRNNGTPTTLTDAMKQGDFSELLRAGSAYQIYDPATRRETAPGVFTADPFPNNIIPQNRINPVTRALLQYWPSPTSPQSAALNGQNNFLQPNLLEVTDYFNNTLRVDHNLTDSQRLFVRWSSYDRDSNYNNYFGNLATGQNFQFVSRSGSGDYVTALSPTMILNLRYGYNRFIRVTGNNPEADGFDLASLGFPQSYTSQIPQDQWQFPRIDITGYQGTAAGGEFRPNDTHAAVATLVQTVGAHTVKYGSEYRLYRENAVFNGNNTVGQFAFDAAYTRGPLSTSAAAPGSLGQSAAAFLLGLPTTATVVRESSYSEQSGVWGFFVHDDWRVTDRLTLNLGVRWELETALEERWGRSIRGFDADAIITPVSTPLRGALTVGEPGVGLYETPKNNIMPRFGFAYRIGENTVLRGGYGMYYGSIGQRRSDVIRNGFSRSTVLNSSPSNNAEFPNNLTNFFTTPILEPRPAAEVPATLVGTNLGSTTSTSAPMGFFNQNPSTPQQQRWQIDIQRQLAGNWLVEAGYVGNRGTRLEVWRDMNALPEQYYSQDPLNRNQEQITFLTQNVPNPYAGTLLIGNTGINARNVQRWQTLRPYPYYGDLVTSTNQGYTWYHALQANVQKRFSQGYTLQASYTLSKFMDATAYLNDFDALPAEQISAADRPHRFVFSGIYELPFGRGQRFLNSTGPVLSRIVGGWQLNAIFTYQSGAPLGNWGNVIFNGEFENIALDNPTPGRWFNTEAGFNRTSAERLDWNVRQFPYRLASVRGDDVNNVDFSVIKNTAITERFNLQFRGEALNAFNTPQFSQPNLDPTNANFGVSTAVDNYARRIQLGIRLVF